MASTSTALAGVNGSKKKFSFDFPYQKKTDIKVELIHATHGATVLDSTKFTPFESATEILFNGDGLTEDSHWQDEDGAPLSGITGRIYRDTDSSKLAATFYPGSAIRSSDLNDNYEQNLYVTQESENDATDALNNSRVLESGSYVSAITKATNAVTTADAADTKADNAVSTANTASASATNAVNTANTANSTASTANTTADAAETKADTAISTANDAETKADNAVSTANTANTTAGTANTTANDAETKADTAVATANAADTIADAAKLATDTYVHDGTTVKGDGVGSNPKGVAYAITTAEAAQASVAASAIYKLNDDLSALTTNYPINADNHEKYVQINDSTGISLSGSGWTPSTFNTPSDVTFPSTFDGNSQLTLKARVNNTSGKYDVVEYYANDPEARYGEDRKMIIENRHTLDEDYVIQSTMNAFSIGPVTISSGKTITIPENSKYVVMN
tara:strand:- start:818 stop:2176 length:1359 start_codon:yes stop_codon:yes gene_type:complete